LALAAMHYAAGTDVTQHAFDGDWAGAAALDEPLQTNVEKAHAEVWAIAKTIVADAKSLPPQQAVDTMRYLAEVMRDMVAGNVHDPFVRKRRTQNTVGKRIKGSTGGARKKPKS